MNENVNREAVASFRGREGRAFTDAQGDFDAAEYIRAVMEDLARDGQLVLDFYHDDFDEDGQHAGGHVEYGVFRLRDEHKDRVEHLIEALRFVYEEDMLTIAEDGDLVLRYLSRSRLSNVYMGRIHQLLQMGAPKVILNHEKRMLVNHLIEEGAKAELISRETALEDGENAPGS